MSSLQSSHSCEYWRSQMLCIVCCCGFRKPFFFFFFFCRPMMLTDLQPFRPRVHPAVIHMQSESAMQETFPLLCQGLPDLWEGLLSNKQVLLIYSYRPFNREQGLSVHTALVNYRCTCSVFMLFLPSLGHCTYVFNTLLVTSWEFSECLTNSTMQGVGSTEIREAGDNTGGWWFIRSGSVLCIDSLVHWSPPGNTLSVAIQALTMLHSVMCVRVCVCVCYSTFFLHLTLCLYMCVCVCPCHSHGFSFVFWRKKMVFSEADLVKSGPGSCV